MPARKPRLPEYPRPVSPVSANEIPACADTIIYYDQANDPQEDAEQRAAKRRRIERHATAYLRGQPPFILSAQLRGPFDGWGKNLWVKGTTVEAKETVEIQRSPAQITQPAEGKRQNHTASKAGHVGVRTAADARLHASGARLHARKARKHARKHARKTRKHATKQTKNNSAESDSSPIRSERPEKSVDQLLTKVELRKARVEDWFRGNAAYHGPEDTQATWPNLSPSEGKVKKWEPQKSNIDLPVPIDAVVNIASNQGLLSCSTSGLRQSHDFVSSLSTPLNSVTPQTALLARNCYTSPLRQKSKDKQVFLGDQPEAATQPYTNEFRAEYAIFNSKRGAEHRPPSAADPGAPPAGQEDDYDITNHSVEPQSSLTLQPFVKEREKGFNPTGNAALGFTDTTARLPNPRDASPANHSELALQSLIQETTKFSMTTDLPSAQVPPLPVMASLPSNLSSHSQMFHEAQDHCIAQAVDIRDSERTVTFGVTAADGTNSNANASHDHERTPPTDRQESVPDDHQYPTKLDGSETPHSIKDHASAVIRSARKAGKGKQNAAYPVGITKARPAKAKRRPVSATEDMSADLSRGTIKSALKVAKQTVVIQDKIPISKTAMLHEEEQQSGGDDGHRPTANTSESPKVSRASAPRSILISSLQSSHRAPVHSNTNNPGSSSNKHSAQRQQLLKLVQNDDDFDLDAAMDDLGSFLGTWDVEKKASLAAAPLTTTHS